jgi:hypothetical protein
MPTDPDVPIGLEPLVPGASFLLVFTFDAKSCVHDPTQKLIYNDACLLPLPPVMQLWAR